MTPLKHPTFDTVTVGVPDKDVPDWVAQGWRPVNEKTPVAEAADGGDGEPTVFDDLKADGGQGAKPKPGPRATKP